MLPRVSALVAVAWFSLVGREAYQIFLPSAATGGFYNQQNEFCDQRNMEQFKLDNF